MTCFASPATRPMLDDAPVRDRDVGSTGALPEPSYTVPPRMRMS